MLRPAIILLLGLLSFTHLALADDVTAPIVSWTPADEAAATPIGDQGLRYLVIREGTGDALTPGHEVEVNYSGWLPDGTPFDSNTDPQFEHVEPFISTIPGRVIRGWNEGLVGMKIGEVRKLYIPSPLAYGPTKRSEIIGPDQDLVFQVELLAIHPVTPWTDDDADNCVEGPGGLKWKSSLIGKEERSVMRGSILTFDINKWTTEGTLLETTQATGSAAITAKFVELDTRWSDAVLGLKPGERRKIWVPALPAIAGAETTDLARHPLVVEVRLITLEGESLVFPWRPDEEAQSTVTDTGLKITDLVVGDGAELTKGKTATMNYTGWLMDGTCFDSNVDPSFGHVQPFTTRIPGGVIEGWNQGLIGMKVGGKRKLQIPPDMAYGSRGAGGVIGPNATLVFEVELTDVR